MSTLPREKPNVAILVTGQALFMIAMVTVMTLSGVVGQQLAPTRQAMRANDFSMGQVVFIMQSHVLGMFVPSFITGSLIARFGVDRILLTGAALLASSAAVAVMGLSLAHFWVSLVLLGVGWSFLFIGGSALLSTVHSEPERGKVQGINDLIIFSLVAIGALLAGQLLHRLGWETLNLAMLPPVLLVALATVWWQSRRRLANQQSG